MHVMRTIAIGDLVVCQFVTRAGCENAAERIDLLFGDPRNIVLDGLAILPRFCQITLEIC